MVKVNILIPVSIFQMLISPVSVALIRNWPIGAKTSALTAPAEPERILLIAPLAVFHRMIRVSAPLLAINWPSGLKAIVRMGA